ncbi:MAG: sensor histidine kinase [Eisenbergiella massiliensis]|uniref:sensor histidine kinase n=1 Tax=Eisenbergiella massiliensis TaxID=1720294 RepID=UPI0039924B0C
MLIRNSEIKELSEKIRKAIDGQKVEFRDNKEGSLSILKNDIHTLVNIKNEQLSAVEQEHALFIEFMENISHQLKTPVTSMMIMADLQQTAAPDKQEEFIHNIQTSLNRMEWLVGTLLKMAKLDADAITFDMEKVSVRALLEAALKPLAILLEIKNQTTDLRNDLELYCDKRWMSEALTNLIKNASEHSGDHTCITIDCGENPIYQWISVTDMGKGIRKEEIARLFTRFEGSGNTSGYGIGLPLALAIVRRHNGDIDVDCGKGGSGATFTIKLYK